MHGHSLLQERIGYSFKNAEYLCCALTHSSYAYENNLGAGKCNERLEFLGDAVLELMTSDYLYKQYAELSEGELTKLRAGLVCEISLAELARQLDIGCHMRMGYGAELGGGRERDSILSDALEAIIGAIYLDGGFESAQKAVHHLIAPKAASLRATFHYADHKTYLQELLQKNSRESAVYVIVNETGPSHQKQFTAAVSHEGRTLGTGVGKSKKEAEQNAAMEALRVLRK